MSTYLFNSSVKPGTISIIPVPGKHTLSRNTSVSYMQNISLKSGFSDTSHPFVDVKSKGLHFLLQLGISGFILQSSSII